MEGTLLGWVLMAGLVALVTVCRADMHDMHHELPAGCSESVVHQCLTPFMPSGGVLVPFSSDNDTVVVAARTRAASDTATWTQVCGAMESAVGCLEPQEKLCFNGSQSMDFTTLLTLNFTVPTVSRLLGNWRFVCTNEMFCNTKVLNCTTTFRDILAELNSIRPNLMDSDNCRQVKEMEDCVGRHMPSKCRAAPSVRIALKDIKVASGYCGEVKCTALQQCKATFMGAGPVASGLDDRTCFLYRNYTRCAENVVASASCSDLTSSEGRPVITGVSDIVEEACTAAGQEGINVMYTCSAFTACVGKVFEQDSTFLPYVCPVMEGVIGCALENADKCPGVNVELRSTFETQLTALSLKSQAQGCGRARVLADKCADLSTCLQSFTLNASTDIMVLCSRIQTFQTCAGNAVEACNLTGPATPPAGAPGKVPNLKALSNVTGTMCSAMQGEPILECQEFLECTKKVNMPMELAWQQINSRDWCHFSVGMVECVRHFSRTCSVNQTLMNAMDDIYRDLLDQGCQNIYGYVIQRPTTGPTTIDPTGGAPSVTGVSLMTTALLLLMTSLRVL